MTVESASLVQPSDIKELSGQSQQRVGGVSSKSVSIIRSDAPRMYPTPVKHVPSSPAGSPTLGSSPPLDAPLDEPVGWVFGTSPRETPVGTHSCM